MRFYRGQNNGVHAVALAELVDQGKPHLVFTFCEGGKNNNRYVTGDLEMMDRVLEGHEVVRRGMYVPFSNGTELLTAPNSDAAEHERAYQTSQEQVRTVFGRV